MKSTNNHQMGLRSRALVITVEHGPKEIRKLHSEAFRGRVWSLVDGKVKACKVEGSARMGGGTRGEFLKIVTPSTPSSNASGYQGPDFGADHPVITEFGPVPVSELDPQVHRIITETPCANPEQLSLILGSLIGDGGFYEQNGGKNRRTNCNVCGLWFSQSAPRLPYVQWKHDSLINLVPGSNRIVTPASGCKNETWRYVLNGSRYLNCLRLSFPRRTAEEHGHRRLVITDEVFDLLGPLGLAVWYMDDGSIMAGGQAMITASKLTPDEIEVCERRWSEFLETDVPYNPASKNFYFSKSAMGAFRIRAGRYIHPSVAYKMPGAGLMAYPVDQSFGGLYAEKILRVVSSERVVKDGTNTRFRLIVPESDNFLTLAGFVGC